MKWKKDNSPHTHHDPFQWLKSIQVKNSCKYTQTNIISFNFLRPLQNKHIIYFFRFSLPISSFNHTHTHSQVWAQNTSAQCHQVLMLICFVCLLVFLQKYSSLNCNSLRTWVISVSFIFPMSRKVPWILKVLYIDVCYICVYIFMYVCVYTSYMYIHMWIYLTYKCICNIYTHIYTNIDVTIYV